MPVKRLTGKTKVLLAFLIIVFLVASLIWLFGPASA